MGLITINTENEKLYEPRSFEPAPSGTYICSLAGQDGKFPLVTSVSKDKGSTMVPVELHIEANADGSETPHKGKIVFDYIVLKAADGTPSNVGEQKLAHLAQCFGVADQEAIRKAGGVDLDLFGPSSRGLVEISIRTEEYEGKLHSKNVVSRYFWAVLA